MKKTTIYIYIYIVRSPYERYRLCVFFAVFQGSCMGFTIVSTTYVSTSHNTHVYCVFETYSCSFASSEILKGRLLK